MTVRRKKATTTPVAGTKSARTSKPASKKKTASKRHPSAAARATRPAAPATGFATVGIGTSAGGLDALERFFRKTPVDSGMAFVVIQHLDPTQKGMLPELLARYTGMPVVQITESLKLKPNHVFVIPPNHDVSVDHGVLHLQAPAAPRGQRLPIDFFLRSLADDQREHSIGVILSGMGTDGTLGLRAIRECAGLLVVQEPSDAQFDGMPRSVIRSDLADIVAPADELPQKIIDFRHRLPSLARNETKFAADVRSDIDKLLMLLRTHTNRDFSAYKPSSVWRRVERRISIHQLKDLPAYLRYVRENPNELDLLFKELLIGVTRFFRDTAAWKSLKTHALPELLKQYPDGGDLRVWVAGCSTGEEAYSLAIVFNEAIAALKPRRTFRLHIFATDLDHGAIDKARQAVYPANIAADVSAERLKQYFVEDPDGYRINGEIRAQLTFAVQDVLRDPPFTKMDLIACRNLLIYLDSDSQKRLMPLFHYSLNPGGVLFLGSAETTGGNADLFQPIDPKSRLFRCSRLPKRVPASEFNAGRFAPRDGKPTANPPSASFNLQEAADQLLLRKFSPAAVLINDKGDIIYISGHTGKYLEPASGRANWNLYAMAREGVRSALTSVTHQARRKRSAVTLNDVRIGGAKSRKRVSITARQLAEPAEMAGMMFVVFTDGVDAATPVGRKSVASGRFGKQIAELQEALRHANDETRSMLESTQVTEEELKSANEELQSTNEELTTSKEEMQSMNEELQTVNAELQSKVDDLMRASNDMKNLLDSTDLAMVFLDLNLNVRRYTNYATRIFKLIPGDIGRPLSDIVSTLADSQLSEDAAEVLRTLAFSEKEICTKSKHWYRVRIMPYRTVDNVIDGLVITLANISEYKALESKLRSKARR